MKMTQRFSLLAGVAMLSLLMALPSVAQRNGKEDVTGGVKGTILGLSGKPLPNAPVILDRKDAPGTITVKTDKNGEFKTGRLPVATYDMSVTTGTGQTVVVEQNMTTVADKTLNVHVNLKILAAAENGAPPPPGMSAEEAAAYKKRKAEAEAKNNKMSQLNVLLAQNKQFRDAKQYDQAIAVMEKAVGIDQTHDVLYANLAQDYADAKQYDKAADAYKKAMALAPTNAGYLLNLGTVLSEQGQTQAAGEAFAKAAKMDPTKATMAMYNQGVILMNKGDMKAAGAAFDSLVKMDPTNANAWYYKALCMLSDAQPDPKDPNKMIPTPGTVEALQKAISLAPNSPNAAQAKTVLKSLDTGGGEI